MPTGVRHGWRLCSPVCSEKRAEDVSEVDLTAETSGNVKAGDSLGHRHHVVQDLDDSPGLQENSLWPVQGSAWKNSMRQGSGEKRDT